MSVHHALNRVCDKLAACKRIMHAVIALCNSVTNTDGWKFNRLTACCNDTFFDCSCNLVKMSVSRHGFILRVDYSNDRLLEIFGKKSHRIVECSVRCTLKAFSGDITFLCHKHYPQNRNIRVIESYINYLLKMLRLKGLCEKICKKDLHPLI